ncbi:GNAT family N-acetyltransferase [Oceanicella actignis]|uniref:Protein N-acetyltransferase, RimJ/RimL family n=1 Tax=Oceanicella actignis TaxID=1189325 RepID=A0A1M7S896_9RHOB|nr:GNAT family protein [Oceanicella actignis]TYO91674.1 RimJ/RimL family protein N-acetyltransferase [Oceanicella actignis]SET33242.1 Protein N-acetyltransferase, RimJ/RimL family [Oceanicella actignis]SHN54584.1 Protein N-acetyltransferase, RimJ/RimL family [Oceanicella actignis]
MTDRSAPDQIPGQVPGQVFAVGERLSLRAPRRSDAGPVSLYLGDARVARMLRATPHPYPPGAAEALIERALSGRRAGRLLAIDASASGGPELAGLVYLDPAGTDARGRPVHEVSFMIGPPFWKTGYATEALDLLAERIFAEGAGALTATVFADDPASARLLTGLGFRWLGETEAPSAARGGPAPAWRYRLSAEDRAARLEQDARARAGG